MLHNINLNSAKLRPTSTSVVTGNDFAMTSIRKPCCKGGVLVPSWVDSHRWCFCRVLNSHIWRHLLRRFGDTSDLMWNSLVYVFEVLRCPAEAFQVDFIHPYISSELGLESRRLSTLQMNSTVTLTPRNALLFFRKSSPNRVC